MGLFKKAVKEAAKLRMAISGPSGSGKTYTALVFATELARHGNGKIAVVDTESGSASKYADDFSFDVAELNNFNPKNYVNAIREAASAGYDVVILDSITHAWNGKGGILDIVGGKFDKWKDVAPLEREFIQTMISHDIHIIATMRAKTQYEVEKDERGKASPRKVGMGAIQRDGIEYEFDIVGMMDLQNTMTIEKTRCSAIRGEVVPTPDGRWLAPVVAWLNAGAEPAEKPAPPVTPTTNGHTNGNGHKPPTTQDGMTAAMMDDAISLAAGLSVEWGQITPTLEMKVSYIRQGKPGARLVAEARTIRRGSSVAFLEAELRDEQGALIATASSTIAITAMKPVKK